MPPGSDDGAEPGARHLTGDLTGFAATAVAIGGRGVLIQGPSGVGKSETALLLIDRGARLISDDRVALRRQGARLLAAPAPNIAGQIEVRNLGILGIDPLAECPVALLVMLTPDAPRWIEQPGSSMIGGVAIPHVALWPGTPALAIKIELALQRYGLQV